mmetsp:Transcript_18218/g.19761  ORF Transcript_18218/g.19761 Transcript_18218/m.19761 type:complete len:161 (+) Transcript_18218:111-593(+)|eukprot:CAMPEP_0173140798 /NCGR_PEP_ID=MMETSP1105-20130129/5109_1 /TAXON_ID=2985 /ORGANISM="Ochromonas sp., Strain BG-1" /LENGTH=160 /DNA_ID=CAMNT_0014053871 /DNA_START=67 /DNA_END=549 /DNA_ORIENTATION=+
MTDNTQTQALVDKLKLLRCRIIDITVDPPDGGFAEEVYDILNNASDEPEGGLGLRHVEVIEHWLLKLFELGDRDGEVYAGVRWLRNTMMNWWENLDSEERKDTSVQMFFVMWGEFLWRQQLNFMELNARFGLRYFMDPANYGGFEAANAIEERQPSRARH